MTVPAAAAAVSAVAVSSRVSMSERSPERASMRAAATTSRKATIRKGISRFSDPLRTQQVLVGRLGEELRMAGDLVPGVSYGCKVLPPLPRRQRRCCALAP